MHVFMKRFSNNGKKKLCKMPCVFQKNALTLIQKKMLR